MSLTDQQARDALVSLHARTMSFEPNYITYVLGVYQALAKPIDTTGLILTPEEKAYADASNAGLIDKAYLNVATMLLGVAYVGSKDPTYSSGPIPLDYINTLTAAQIVDFIYPSASNRKDLINLLESSAISHAEFGAIAGITSSTNPSAQDFIAGASKIEIVNPLPPSNDLPVAALSFPGVSEKQQEFMVAMYVGAFNRAPEYEGIKFWEKEFDSHMKSGASESDALLRIGESMYQAGAQNGEGGTNLNNSDYVAFAYKNALGRQYDAEGFTYWVDKLSTGEVGRGQFLTTFLSAALQNAGDGQYLKARIAVAEHAAQEHVSGAHAPGIDLVKVVDGVSNSSSALAAIQVIRDTYGTVKHGTSGIDAEVVSGATGKVTIGETVSFLDTAAGKVAFEDVERLDIDGKNLALDVEGNAGMAYRVYQAAFSRTPDKDGLGYWISKIDQGASLETVASGFLNSDEFKSLYGANLSTADFVNALYHNVLGRGPDSEGLKYWESGIDSSAISRASALAGFAESHENKVNLAGQVEHGIEYTPFI